MTKLLSIFFLSSIIGTFSFNKECSVTLESLSEPGKTITVPAFSDALASYGIGVELNTLSRSKGACRFSLSVRNDGSAYAVKSISGPCIGVFCRDDVQLVTSSKGGKRIPVEAFRSRKDPKVKIADNGRQCTMEWFAFAGAKDGLYLACENPSHSNVSAVVEYDRNAGGFKVGCEYRFYCHPGQQYTTPVVDIHKYKGDWHVAADFYRKWFLSVHKFARRPEWLQNCNGWLLAILKQQNGEIIWPYETIGNELADAAKARGLDVVGLYGRAAGGHDSCYPDYTSDPAMGGREALCKGIAKLHEKGLHCIMYVNGQLIDWDYAWFEEHGRHISVTKSDGSLLTDSYQKFKDGRNVKHSIACLHTDLWQDMMIKMAEDANSLGADGIIFDQLGRGRTRVCYNPDHGHKVPGLTYQEDLTAVLQKVYDHMQKINPDFVLMTEGFFDSELPGVAFYHRGSMPRIITQKQMEAMALHSKNGWMAPEVLLYTFPEKVNTSNDPAPVNDRQRLNLNAVFNERTEIEVRYAFDKDLILNDRVQDRSCFDNIEGSDNPNGKYHMRLATTGNPAAAREYSLQIHSWLAAYPELMRTGRFIDDRKFNCTSDNPMVISKAYESADGKTLGVIVWNVSTKNPAGVKVKPARGYRLKEITAPEGVATADSPLAAQSVRLYVFSKR